jgi:hypothetical protein
LYLEKEQECEKQGDPDYLTVCFLPYTAKTVPSKP